MNLDAQGELLDQVAMACARAVSGGVERSHGGAEPEGLLQAFPTDQACGQPAGHRVTGTAMIAAVELGHGDLTEASVGQHQRRLGHAGNDHRISTSLASFSIAAMISSGASDAARPSWIGS